MPVFRVTSRSLKMKDKKDGCFKGLGFVVGVPRDNGEVTAAKKSSAGYQKHVVLFQLSGRDGTIRTEDKFNAFEIKVSEPCRTLCTHGC